MEYPKRLYVTIITSPSGERKIIEDSIEEFGNLGVQDGAEICIYEVVGKAKLRTSPALVGETKPLRKGRPFGSKNRPVVAPAAEEAAAA